VPVVPSSAFDTAGDVLNRIRTILNDSEIAGGDVITNTAPFAFDLVNAGYETVQRQLAQSGDETNLTTAWLIGLPAMPVVDPEGRMIVDDTGTSIIYPTPASDVFFLTPQLPTDLVVPVRLWERQTGTTNFTGGPMKQPSRGLLNLDQQTYLIDWEWKADGLRFRGALQSQDVKIEYEKKLPKLAAPTDPVPIRGVLNAAAYHSALIFAQARGGTISPAAKAHADEEVSSLRFLNTRRRQHIQRRRQPYSGQGGRRSPMF
jgi:hypothetical protein